MQAKTINIRSVIPDESQPRQYFAADKMAALRASIKKEGIISPLIVQDMGAGKFLLVDGERRFRAATELGFKEVPVVIEEATDATQRLVRQFNIQEQHEQWTPIEKAIALIKLSKELKVTLSQVTRLLHIGESVADRYVAFSNLADKDAYVKGDIPLDYAQGIISLRATAKNLYLKILKKDFPLSMEKQLERRVIKSIKDGVIVRRAGLTRLKDTFTKEPRLIEKYLKDSDITPNQLFLEAKAEGAFALRNLIHAADYVSTYTRRFMESMDVKVSTEQLEKLKSAELALKKLIAAID